MAATHMICAGKIVGGTMTLAVAVALPPVTSQERNAILLERLEQGRELFEAGFTRSACRNQDEEAGYDAAACSAIGADTAGEPVDGWLQQEIDYAAELEELTDGIEDEEWNRRGMW